MTQAAADGLRPDETGRINVGGREGVARLVVSRAQLRHALLLLAGLLREAERCGHEVNVHKGGYGEKPGVAIVVRENAVGLKISESTDRIPLEGAELERWRQENRWRLQWQGARARTPAKLVPNGKLKLSVASEWDGSRNSWSEGPRGGIETKFDSFFAELEKRADVALRRREEWARRDAERRAVEEERLARAREAEIEQARIARLLEEVNAWQRAASVREYVAALRARLDGVDPEERQRLAAWCTWAEEWADRSDPVTSTGRISGLA